MNPIILMVKAKTQRMYVNVESAERIDSLVRQLKSELSLQSLWVFSPGGSDTQSTAITVQSKFGEGSYLKYHLERDVGRIAQKAKELSLDRPVLVVLRDSPTLHRVAKWLIVPVDHGKFKTTEGVIIDIVRKTAEVFTAE